MTTDRLPPTSETLRLIDEEPCKLFLREWRARFSDHKDWTAANVTSDNSSLLLFLRYVKQSSERDANLSTICTVLDRAEKEGHGPPRFNDFRRRHRMLMGSRGGYVDSGRGDARCEPCDDTGVLCVPTVRRLGKSYLVKCPIVLMQGEHLYEQTVPCRCTKGQAQNRHTSWQYSDEQLARFAQYAVTRSQFDALVVRCMELSGMPVQERTPDPEFREWLQSILCAVEFSRQARESRELSERERIEEATLIGAN